MVDNETHRGQTKERRNSERSTIPATIAEPAEATPSDNRNPHEQPLVTFTVPCYNSAAYMDRCIASIVDVAELVCVAPADDIEVLIVDDGSTDDGATLARARSWEARHPGLIRAIHQENGGPGEAINTGLAQARGTYFKVVDSDDWLDGPSLAYVLVKLWELCKTSDNSSRASVQPGDAGYRGDKVNGAGTEGGRPIAADPSATNPRMGLGHSAAFDNGNSLSGDYRNRDVENPDPMDAVVCNYVYEHEDGTPERPVRYEHEFPQNRAFGWDDLLHPFPLWNYMMMHSVIWRTDMLRATGLRLPAHTFYVDEIVVYVGLAHARTLMYLDVDLYRYLIGRTDQSVNEQIMASRCDQQVRVTRIKIDAVDVRAVEGPGLRRYLVHDLTITMCFCTVFTTLSNRTDRFELRDGIWNYLRQHDERLWRHIRWSFIGWWCNLRSPAGVAAFEWGYRTVRDHFRFN